MIIIDDLLSPQHFHHIRTYFCGEEPAWYYNGNLSGTEDGEKYGFGMGIVHHEGGIVNPLAWQMTYPILAIAADKAGKVVDQVYSIRSFMTLPMRSLNVEGTIHRDLDWEHTVLLYYVTDNDEPSADTLFYEDNQVIERITPKANRGVLFNGSQLHAGGLPTKERRIIINFDFRELTQP